MNGILTRRIVLQPYCKLVPIGPNPQTNDRFARFNKPVNAISLIAFLVQPRSVSTPKLYRIEPARTSSIVVSLMRPSSRLQAAIPRHIKIESSYTSLSALCSSPAGTWPLKVPVKGEKCQNGPVWTPLCSTRVLSCALTLESGQVFAWRRHPEQVATWLGVINRRVFALRERDHIVHFRCLNPADGTWLAPVLAIEKRGGTFFDNYDVWIVCKKCQLQTVLVSYCTTFDWMYVRPVAIGVVEEEDMYLYYEVCFFFYRWMQSCCTTDGQRERIGCQRVFRDYGDCGSCGKIRLSACLRSSARRTTTLPEFRQWWIN